MENLYDEALALLMQLISTPSFSKDEQGTASVIQRFLQAGNINPERVMNNVWCRNKYYDASKPTILLNSHHDTVHPNQHYTINPFHPIVDEGKLFGLGSNDAGASLVSLLAAFLYFYEMDNLKYNLVFAASAEEEISGENGIAALLPVLGEIDFAIVGEPTLMDMAVAEKGLLVLDCVAEGVAGHAARNEGVNAIYNSLKDIGWFSSYNFAKISDVLGPVKMSVTTIQAGVQHNVVPDVCKFTVDVRVNECYTHDEVLAEIRANVSCRVKPRSMRLRSSSIDEHHPIVVAGHQLGKNNFGSATLSDKALMPFPALKMGPGDSARSHTADEFVYLDEIEQGIETYIALLTQVLV